VVLCGGLQCTAAKWLCSLSLLSPSEISTFLRCETLGYTPPSCASSSFPLSHHPITVGREREIGKAREARRKSEKNQFSTEHLDILVVKVIS
jgi:hypothetical protein